MRIWIGALALTTTLAAFLPLTTKAQEVVITNGVAIIVPARPVVSPPAPAITPQNIVPNLAMSNATPTIEPSGIPPATPSPGAAGIPQSPGSRIATQPFTTGIGQQGSTAIGQQGSTAIGQQGVGTAIVPENTVPQNNAIVIGQPEPFNPAPAVAAPSAGNILPGAVAPNPSAISPQQNVGTAIAPANNAIIIGQPEPFNPPPPAVIPATPPAKGLPGEISTNSPVIGAAPQTLPVRPTTPTPTPTGPPAGRR